VLHIELRRWADILLVAPASANTLAKAANGICDNLLLCVIRAWDRMRPAILCPAMNTVMLEHPAILTHLSLLRSYGFTILDTDVKYLACGDVGKGALASLAEIVKACEIASLSIHEDPDRNKEKEAANKTISLILKSSNDANGHCSTPTMIAIATVFAATSFLVGYLVGAKFESVIKTIR
jgi:phosphopantothenoylcysteine synthetase/decarboxylase